ncbi:DsbA family protein [Amphritea sp. HPY]|uniref:DsbA family protein n=1 Tax=Amphritea sp. HPY TaxID=3421652 RepID=UPI003D7CE9EC
MNNTANGSLPLILRLILPFTLAILLITVPVYANQDGDVDQQLVERIKAEVIQELRNSDWLQQEIDTGIQNYITTQRETRAKAQADARAEKERSANEKARNARSIEQGRDHIYGNPEASISLIEYSDFECPYCKRFHQTVKNLIDLFDGQVNWVYRHYPLSFHNPGAQKQAEAAECAYEQGGDEAFWRYTDAIYQRTQSGGKGFALDKLSPLAAEFSLDADVFQECLDSNRYSDRVKEDFEDGQQAGITGTPGNILINNLTGQVLAKSGSQPLEAFKQAIEGMLKQDGQSN